MKQTQQQWGQPSPPWPCSPKWQPFLLLLLLFFGGRCRGRGPTAASCSGPEAAERLTSRVRAPSPNSPLPATLPPNRHNLTLPSKQGQHPSCCCLPGAPQSRAEQSRAGLAWPCLAALPPPPRKLQLPHSERLSKGFWTFSSLLLFLPPGFPTRPDRG